MSALPNWKTMEPSARTERLVALCNDGLSASQISFSFSNCPSANAVVGMVHRLQTKGVKIALTGKFGGGTRKLGPSVKPRTAKPSAPRSSNPKPNKALMKAANGLLVPVPMRGPNNPHRNDFKGRAEQRAASPGIEIRREFAFDPLPDTPPRSISDQYRLPLAGRRRQRPRPHGLRCRQGFRALLLRSAPPPLVPVPNHTPGRCTADR